MWPGSSSLIITLALTQPIKHALVVFQSLRGIRFRASAPTCNMGRGFMGEYVMYVRLHVCVCIMFVTNDSEYDRAAVHL